MGATLIKEISCDQSKKILDNDGVSLPSFSGVLESTLSKGELLNIDGTNVVRVPFGVRQARRQRPDVPKRLATLVLPLQPNDSPNPPPHAA